MRVPAASVGGTFSDRTELTALGACDEVVPRPSQPPSPELLFQPSGKTPLPPRRSPPPHASPPACTARSPLPLLHSPTGVTRSPAWWVRSPVWVTQSPIGANESPTIMLRMPVRLIRLPRASLVSPSFLHHSPRGVNGPLACLPHSPRGANAPWRGANGLICFMTRLTRGSRVATTWVKRAFACPIEAPSQRHEASAGASASIVLRYRVATFPRPLSSTARRPSATSALSARKSEPRSGW